MLFWNVFNATKGQGVVSLLEIFFKQIWVYFSLKDRAINIQHNSSNILSYLIGVTKAKNML